MIRCFLIIVLIFAGLNGGAQVDSAGLKDVVKKLDKALVEKDQASLQAILHKEVSFGHSNAWVQSKQEILDDSTTGKLVYNRIDNNRVQIVAINKKWATVRSNVHAEGIVNGNAFKLALHVMQVWIKTKKGWLLIARQSAKQ